MSSSSGAVISLQLGNYSNYVGTHFWNFQEAQFVFPGQEREGPIPDVDHDVLFRQGETLGRQITYTPRLVAVDLKGALGLLPQLGDLYEDGGGGGFRRSVPRTDSLLWGGGTEVKKEEPRRKNDFQRELEAEENYVADEDKDVCEDDKEVSSSSAASDSQSSLDNQVEFWSDFLRPRLHPRTNVLLREYQHSNSLRPFDVFGLGSSAYGDDGDGEEVEDAVRFFAEEADSVQGFHLTFDSSDAFGGLASRLLQALSDDYPGKTVLAFPLIDCNFGGGTSSPAANSARY